MRPAAWSRSRQVGLGPARGASTTSDHTRPPGRSCCRAQIRASTSSRRHAGNRPPVWPRSASDHLLRARQAHRPHQVLHAAARRKLLDGGALSADSPVHRAAGVAPDVIRAARPSARRAIASGGVPAKDVVSQASPRRAGTRVAGAARRAVSPITNPPYLRPDGAIATRQSRSGRQMVPNRKSQLSS